MSPEKITEELEQNKKVFRELLSNIPKESILWSQNPEKWCLLEVVCHLYDEEREDFRTRVKCVLEDPALPPPPFDPLVWVEERKYKEQNYDRVLSGFLKERENSIEWLKSLEESEWSNAYLHPKLGPMSAYLYLTNWLAHDYLHMRQIIRLKFDYLKWKSGESLNYAGDW
jgi:hypothetical protein